MKQVNNRQKMFVKPNQNVPARRSATLPLKGYQTFRHAGVQKFVVAGRKTQKAVEMKNNEARIQKLRIGRRPT